MWIALLALAIVYITVRKLVHPRVPKRRGESFRIRDVMKGVSSKVSLLPRKKGMDIVDYMVITFTRITQISPRREHTVRMDALNLFQSKCGSLKEDFVLHILILF